MRRFSLGSAGGAGNEAFNNPATNRYASARSTVQANRNTALLRVAE